MDITYDTHLIIMPNSSFYKLLLTLFLSATHFTVGTNIPDEFSPLINKKQRDYVKYIGALERQTREDLLYSPEPRFVITDHNICIISVTVFPQIKAMNINSRKRGVLISVWGLGRHKQIKAGSKYRPNCIL